MMKQVPGSWFGFVLLVIAQLATVSASCAQNPPVAPPAPAQSQQPPASAPLTPATQPLPDRPVSAAQNDESKNQTVRSKDRLFYAMPNFLTVENAQKVPRLGARQKFEVVTRSTFDPFQFVWYAALAGISQASNSEPGYGQGWGAYGVRYASAFGDGLIESYMVGAVFPSVLRQDPRYYVLGHGTVLHRTGYALSRLIVIRSDAGKAQFNASEVFGSALAAGISTYSYHPHDDKTLSNTASVWGTQVGYDAIAIVVKEFWPDVRRKFSEKKQAKHQN